MALPVRRRETAPQPVQRWDPFRELETVHERLDQLMQSAFGEAPGNGSRVWTPLVDIEETEDAWIVEAELPGVMREDVNVEVRDSELSISGEIRERERTGILRRRARRTGEFDYTITLPGKADAENVEATLADGVLMVRIPKPEQARPKRIQVKAAGAGVR
jgi:HSP20 family protein